MQIKLISIIIAISLAVAIFISTSDARHIPSQFNRRNQEAVNSNSKSACGPCPDDSNFSQVHILRGNDNHKSYMFVDLLSPNGCCDVIAKDISNPLDIRGKVPNNCTHITMDTVTCSYNSYYIKFITLQFYVHN